MIYRDRTEFISNPTDFPDLADATSKVVEIQEPIVNASIIVPEGTIVIALPMFKFGLLKRMLMIFLCRFLEYTGEMMDLCFSHRAMNLDHRYLDSSASSACVILTCQLPLSEIVTDFFSLLKSRSSGYASFE